MLEISFLNNRTDLVVPIYTHIKLFYSKGNTSIFLICSIGMHVALVDNIKLDRSIVLSCGSCTKTKKILYAWTTSLMLGVQLANDSSSAQK